MTNTSFPPILKLGDAFYDQVEAANFPQLILRYRNQNAADSVGLSALSDQAWIEHFGRFSPLPQNLEFPLALRYHGHQFTHYNPELGDGRGFLFAQLRDQSGRLLDLGTKGSGQTPYSRQGDGRLTLKGAVREILATEILELYGVNTSKTFSVIETGEALKRHDEPSPTRSAVLVRLNHSHIRFGTFQRLAYFNEQANIKKLIRYSVEHYFTELSPLEDQLLAEAFLAEVIQRSADLVASWMMAGFVHGVMNTDNMNITGESFDYGPYRFLPHYDINFTAAYFDNQGLYRFGRQPITMLWNLEQLAKSILVAYPELNPTPFLEAFGEHFNQSTQKHFLRRLNLKSKASDSSVSALLESVFTFAETSKAPFEQLIFDLHSGWDRRAWEKSPLKQHYVGANWDKILSDLNSFEIQSQSLLNTSYYQGDQPQSLIYQEIEDIWAPIATHDDWRLFYKKIENIKKAQAECLGSQPL